MSLLERCVRAAEACAAACGQALAADAAYTSPGTERYSEAHLALVSCESVCMLVVRALREGDGDLALLQWCAESCAQCAAGEAPVGMPDAAWSLATRANLRCAIECHDVIERISEFAGSAIGASRDTDFQGLRA